MRAISMERCSDFCTARVARAVGKEDVYQSLPAGGRRSMDDYVDWERQSGVDAMELEKRITSAIKCR